MITLEQLALQEQQIADAVRKTRGSLAEKAEQLARGGQLESYREVHRQYAELARSGDIEALRRATFLQWYQTTEPVAFTALSLLDRVASDDVIALLDGMCQAKALDAELSWMLPYYTLIAPQWFKPPIAPALAKFCVQNRPGPRGSVVPLDGFVHEGRGLLGSYWASK
jgi:hypothetical protein